MLEHAAKAGGELPAGEIGRNVFNVIIEGVELEIQLRLLFLLLKLLPAVLLVAHKGLDAALPYFNTIVQNSLVVVHLLERQFQGIARGAFQDAAFVTFREAGSEVVITQRQARETPFFIESQARGEGPFAQLGSGHQTIGRIAVGVGIFVAETEVVHKAVHIAAVVKAVGR